MCAIRHSECCIDRYADYCKSGVEYVFERKSIGKMVVARLSVVVAIGAWPQWLVIMGQRLVVPVGTERSGVSCSVAETLQ